MTMYYCYNCGEDFCSFPAVILSVNSNLMDYPRHHDSLFEEQFNDIKRANESPTEPWNTDEVWKQFYTNLPNIFLCSKKCAIEFLTKFVLDESGKEIHIGDTVLLSDSDDYDVTAYVQSMNTNDNSIYVFTEQGDYSWEDSNSVRLEHSER